MGSCSVPPVGRANNLSSFGIFVPVSMGGPRLNNCNNTLCYTYNHNYIYQPHSG